MDNQRKALKKIRNIWYNQNYREAVEIFKGMSKEKILNICKAKKESFDLDLEKCDPEDNHSYDDSMNMLLNKIAAKAYKDAGSYILKKGSIN